MQSLQIHLHLNANNRTQAVETILQPDDSTDVHVDIDLSGEIIPGDAVEVDLGNNELAITSTR